MAGNQYAVNNRFQVWS